MTFKEFVNHQLCEMKRELLTAIEGVDEKAMTSFGPVNHWPVAWIAEHCPQIADAVLYKPVKGTQMHEYADQVQNWTTREPVDGDRYPDRQQIASRWETLCDWIIDHTRSLEESELQNTENGQAYLENILLAVNHTNSHLRSLWCLLGQLRLDDKWAEQQSYKACD